MAALLLAGALAPVAAAASPSDYEAGIRGELAAFRGTVESALAGYEAAHANYTEARADGNGSAAEAAKGEMREAANAVGAAFLRFETGHGDNASLSAFMQGKMPPTYYNAFERNVVLLRAMMLPGGAGDAPTPAGEVAAQGAVVRKALERAESCVPDGCRSGLVSVGAQAFLVLVREGFEAILLVGAAVAYLRKSNRGERARLVWAGVVAGLVASALAWVALRWLFGAAAASASVGRAVMEGATMLLAAGVLFYVSFWLLGKVEAQRWQAYLDGKLRDSLSGERAWTLGVIGFLAVFREGVETVLFLEALGAHSGGAWGDIGVGLALGAVALAAIYVAVHHLGVKVPLRAFFAVTSAILMFLAVRFTGMGLFELQEAGVLGVTPLGGAIAFLAAHPVVAVLVQDVAGFAPTLEVAVGQGVLLAVVALGGAYTLAGQARARPVDG